MIVRYRMAVLLALVLVIAPVTRALAADQAVPSPDATSAQQLAQARNMVQQVLNNWDFMTWNEVLAPDVQVNLKLGTVATDTAGRPAAVGADLQVKGREQAKKALKQVYGDLKKNVNITGQVAYGYEVILFGDLNVAGQQGKPESLPITCYMHFNPQGQIDKLTLASVDTRPLIDAAKRAAPDKR